MWHIFDLQYPEPSFIALPCTLGMFRELEKILLKASLLVPLIGLVSNDCGSCVVTNLSPLDYYYYYYYYTRLAAFFPRQLG